MSSSKRAKRCWFCGQRHVRPGDPPEHILGAAIGAELTTDAVACSCNKRAGKEVDQPLANDPFVAFNRVFYDIRDRRGNRPPNPVRGATLEDGTPVALETRNGPWEATVVPYVREQEDRLIITAGSVEEAEELIAKKSERTGQKFRVVEERRSQEEHPRVLFTLSLDTRIRVRARAKMVLGVLSKVFPEEWLDSPEARQLQEWLWDPRPKLDGEQIGAMHHGAEGILGYMCEPPEHLVSLQPMGVDRLMVTIILFGKEVIPCEVQLPGVSAPDNCWVMNPKTRKVRELSYIELVHEVGARLDRVHAERDQAA
jgi:hypothetical protein